MKFDRRSQWKLDGVQKQAFAFMIGKRWLLRKGLKLCAILLDGDVRQLIPRRHPVIGLSEQAFKRRICQV